eukprot:TRINITY_DN8270_c0_g1_i1.p1 TRINITY_DN8270_c0_g1~~TRINITY_DN8270_c0_g1_i1.p1  ORF type:complete len:303 (-),score=47.06 TRINITY_DN8270_c0_g1_i1:24-932(-)
MISPFFSQGLLRFGTKQGITDTTTYCETFVDQSGQRYREFCEFWINKGYTPTFEYCTPHFPIVLHYDEESLKLIALRNMIDGTYYPFQEMVQSASEYGIPVVGELTDEFNMNPSKEDFDFEAFYMNIKSKVGFEGFVIRFEDGSMYKIKTNWYFSINKKLDKIKNGSVRHLWQCVLEEEYDDVKTFLSPTYRRCMDDFVERLGEALVRISHRLMNELKEKVLEQDLENRGKLAEISRTCDMPQKLFWSLIDNYHKSDLNFITRKLLVDYILSNLSTYKKFESNVLNFVNVEYTPPEAYSLQE